MIEEKEFPIWTLEEIKNELLAMIASGKAVREARKALKWVEKGEIFRKIGRHCCGARTKTNGGPCQIRNIYQNGRCRFHGGLSTGPKTEEGKKKVSQNARKKTNPMKTNKIDFKWLIEMVGPKDLRNKETTSD